MSFPYPHVLAGSGVVLVRPKSLELITRKVCSLFRGKAVGQQDTVQIKAEGQTKQQKPDKWTKTFSFLLPAVRGPRS